ncbi:MAG: winged helix-turn-helix transcriptional regulator [Chloroflexi bacterium]|nr:winged helix-turn-helix transcriptional regulator [Chloroflexota bacterium]
MPDLPHPLTFRSEIIEPLVESIRAGESCALVGVGSSGKSNIVRFLRERDDARQHYFGADARRLLWLMVDCNALDSYEEHSLYAAMIDSLTHVVSARSDLGALNATLGDLYREAVSPELRSGAFRALSRAVEAVKAASNFQFVFVLDDCDTLVQKCQPALFRRLRALRDDSKYQLVYITVTRRELHRLRPTSPEFESFFEIAVMRSFAVGPYSDADARTMLERLAARLPQPRPLEPLAIDRLLTATGGHPGLIKAAFFATRAGETALESDLIETLINDSAVMDECRKIWDSLEDEEHAGLVAASQGRPVTGPALGALMAKGLIRERTDGTHAILCPPLETYVSQKAGARAATPPPNAKGGEAVIEIFPGVKLVRVDGREVSGLSKAEFDLLCVLAEKRGQACSRSLLLERVFAAEAHRASELDAALDRAVAELKRKIEPPGKVLIASAPGGGYQCL